MCFKVLGTTIAFVCAVSAARAQSSSDDSIQVGIFGYEADGSVVVSAWQPVPSKRSMVFASGFCRVGAGFREVPDYATDAWHFTWSSISKTEEAAVIQIDWQRVLASGQPVRAPTGSGQLTLQWGETVVLDNAAGPSPAGCNATAMTFEARYGPHPMRTGVRANARPAVTTSAAVGAFRVNLWFVRNVPGQPEEVLAHPVLKTTNTGTFRFGPVKINVADGSIDVHVNGSFSIDTSANPNQLTFTIERAAAWKPLETDGDRPQEVRGYSKRTIPLPGPDEVISLEMPPVRFSGRPALADQFAVRLQIAGR